MKYFYSLLFLVFAQSLFAQNSSKGHVAEARRSGPELYELTLYFYKTYNDFTNDTPKNVGRFSTYSTGMWGKPALLHAEQEDGSWKVLEDKGNWGFKVDKYVFRVYDGHTPLLVLGQYNGKILYLNGQVNLRMMALNSNTGRASADDEQFFYSDTPTSEVFSFDKLEKNVKGNEAFKPLLDCFRQAKKERGSENQFNEKRLCLKGFAEEL